MTSKAVQAWPAARLVSGAAEQRAGRSSNGLRCVAVCVKVTHQHDSCVSPEGGRDVRLALSSGTAAGHVWLQSDLLRAPAGQGTAYCISKASSTHLCAKSTPRMCT
jgi:hypothetical protein